MTDVATVGGNSNVLSEEKRVVLFPDRMLSFPPTVATAVILPHNAINSTVTTNATTETVKFSF